MSPDAGWTPVAIATLVVASLAAIPGFIALVQNLLNRPKPRMIGVWKWQVGDSHWAELTVTNLGGAEAMDVRVYVPGTIYAKRPVDSFTRIPFDATVVIGLGQGVSRGQMPIVDLGKEAKRGSVRVVWRVPPHNRRWCKVYRYRFPTSAKQIMRDMQRPSR